MVLLGGKQRTVAEFRELARAAWLEGISRRAATIRRLYRRMPSGVTPVHRLHQSSAGCNMAAGTDVAIRHFVLGLILLKWRHKMVMRNPIHIASTGRKSRFLTLASISPGR